MNAVNKVVTCLDCNEQSRIKIIDEQQIFYLDHLPIIAARLRPDMKWGFECICGNDTRLAPEEKKDIEMLVAGSDEGVIPRIIEALTSKPELKFRLDNA